MIFSEQAIYVPQTAQRINTRTLGFNQAIEEMMSADNLNNEKVSSLPLGKQANTAHSEEKNTERHVRHSISEQMKLMYLSTLVLFVFMIFIMASIYNPDLYQIDKETLILINQAFNALVLLTIPFLLGMLGAVSRILIAGLKVVNQTSLILSSGLMATFSWIGIKSGVLLAIVAPHLEIQGIPPEGIVSSPSNFYTMALVAVLVGMFSTNLYLFINQKVEQLTKKSNKETPNEALGIK
ncbi:hypothetical protein ACE02L_02400 [Shewanella seohaensis]|uniref:Uncharacterized protein n=2 Tax=Shewanella seohaensis TaxID=755175 RepID=A0ABV4VQY9_9GAMM